MKPTANILELAKEAGTDFFRKFTKLEVPPYCFTPRGEPGKKLGYVEPEQTLAMCKRESPKEFIPKGPLEGLQKGAGYSLATRFHNLRGAIGRGAQKKRVGGGSAIKGARAMSKSSEVQKGSSGRAILKITGGIGEDLDNGGTSEGQVEQHNGKEKGGLPRGRLHVELSHRKGPN